MENIKLHIESIRSQVVDMAEKTRTKGIILDNPHRNDQEVASEDPVTQISNQFMTLRLLMQRFMETFDREFLPWIRQTKNQQLNDFDPERHVIGKTSAQVLGMFSQIQDMLQDLQGVHEMYQTLTENVGVRVKEIADEHEGLYGGTVLHELSTLINVLEASLARMAAEKKRGRLSTKVLGLSKNVNGM
jgi:hypothetical protein